MLIYYFCYFAVFALAFPFLIDILALSGVLGVNRFIGAFLSKFYVGLLVVFFSVSFQVYSDSYLPIYLNHDWTDSLEGILHATFGVWVYVNTIASYLFASSVFDFGDHSNTGSRVRREDEDVVDDTPQCWTCHAPKPKHMYHCQHCRKCIPHVDHHCPFTGTCITLDRSFAMFFLFVTYAWIGSVYAAILAYTPFSLCILYNEDDGTPVPDVCKRVTLELGLGFVPIVMLLIPLTILWVFQIYLWITRQTTRGFFGNLARSSTRSAASPLPPSASASASSSGSGVSSSSAVSSLPDSTSARRRVVYSDGADTLSDSPTPDQDVVRWYLPFYLSLFPCLLLLYTPSSLAAASSSSSSQSLVNPRRQLPCIINQ
eukprot:TRINITY_DN1226_c1_g1_i1.p1 TRINITY_DN1226_c1_g1~~TRINITY_DN1226_c1_g1_i1.p1  ORF type:complete len:372 (+),score=29.53 TRINITY_DN1226_c1_g1_i1:50-1165(+)